MTDPELTVFSGPEMMARKVADWFTLAIGASHGPIAVALSGGSTPRRLYELMSKSALPWDKIHWFLGDERFVPHDDTDSNYRMIREALFDRAPVPQANIHPVTTEGLTPDDSARAYEAELRRFHGTAELHPDQPLFHVTILGLGADGHTASLFPGAAVLGETARWVAPVIGAKPEDRITLTYTAIDSSRYAIFLVSGAEKRDMLKRLLAGDQSIPAGRVRPTGELVIFADEAAAG
jgi:6-phosphogluconolactonase